MLRKSRQNNSEEETELLSTKQVSHPNKHSLFFPKKSYTTSEKIVHKVVNLPGTCLRQNKLFKNEIAKGNYVIHHDMLVYRADTRSPTVIFKDGFSPYSITKCLLPNNNNNFDAATTLMLYMSYILCSPLIAPLYLGYDPSCGRDLYKAPYVANWSVLSLSLDFEHAIAWCGDSNNYWRYIIYLDGCIQFSEFSNFLIENKLEKNPGGKVYDAKEIFPPSVKDQSISATRIIAATHCKGKDADLDSKKLFLFNRGFSGWSVIKDKLMTDGLSDDIDNMPQLMISPKSLKDFLKQDLLDADLGPSAQMML